MASQEEDDNYRRVFTILEEAKLTHLKSIFKDNRLQVRLTDHLSLASRQPDSSSLFPRAKITFYHSTQRRMIKK